MVFKPFSLVKGMVFKPFSLVKGMVFRPFDIVKGRTFANPAAHPHPNYMGVPPPPGVTLVSNLPYCMFDSGDW